MPNVTPTIYWYCPKPDAPSGGVWFIHRLAQLCQGAVLPARVVRVGAEPWDVWWDAHPVNESDLPLRISPDGGSYPHTEGDTIVVPEVMWAGVPDQGARKIMFLQNYIWLGEDTRQRLREAPATEILVPSRYLYNWCERVLGVTPIGILTPFLDADAWAPTPKTANLTVLYARRNPDMAERLAAGIQAAGFPLEVIIGDYSQRDLRSWLDRAEFYVHHVEPEGFPMAALEAMRSGVIVVGTSGGGGNEFMFNDETALVTPGPLLGRYEDPGIFVAKVVGQLERLRADAGLRSNLWTQAYAWSLRYRPDATVAQLQKVFHG